MSFSNRSLIVKRILIAAVLLGIVGGLRASADDERFELRDGDRVVLLGGTFIERAQRYGWIETALTAQFPDRHVVFRNLAWSGDTVWAESRGIFESPETGYRKMLAQVATIKPTVLMLAYGSNEAFAGQPGLEPFVTQYDKLVDDLIKASADGVRLVFFSPTPIEKHPPPLRDPAEYNGKSRLYAGAIAQLAARRRAVFVDLNSALTRHWETAARSGSGHLTDDGIHFTSEGYRIVADLLRRELFRPASEDALPDLERLGELRAAIVKKNELYFHHWRPQNVTYLFLFRKHEQGQNAKEVAEFEKLVTKQEAVVARIRQQQANRNP